MVFVPAVVYFDWYAGIPGRLVCPFPSCCVWLTFLLFLFTGFIWSQLHFWVGLLELNIEHSCTASLVSSGSDVALCIILWSLCIYSFISLDSADCADLVWSPICRDDTFADIHNLDHCIKYLNQSLVTFGFPSGLNLYSSEPVSASNHFIASRFVCLYTYSSGAQSAQCSSFY